MRQGINWRNHLVSFRLKSLQLGWHWSIFKYAFVVDPWVYESKQIYWDLQQLNYDVKLMWIPTHVGVSGNKVANGLARQAVESGTVHGQLTVANDHRILARQAMFKQ
jgi:ribonuclease HI